MGIILKALNDLDRMAVEIKKECPFLSEKCIDIIVAEYKVKIALLTYIEDVRLN